jgi:DNA excision repair protein ERCC-4
MSTHGMVPVVVDTRESRPYLFDSSVVEVRRAALAAGDYSLVGSETRVAIERKSLDDFVNTLIHARDRFRAELDILQTYDYAAIVIEANVDDLLAGRYESDAAPAALFGIWCSIITDRRIPAYFLSDRQTAQFAVQQMLARLHRRGSR